MSQPVVKAHFALFFTNFFFAINYTAIKFFTSNHIAGPFGINILRVGGCVVLFWFLFLFRKEKVSIERRDLFKIAVCSFTAIALNQMLFIKGLSYTSPLHASLLTLISPILITVFASVILREKLTILKSAGLILACAGSVLLLSGKETKDGDNYLLGDLLIIASAAAYSVYFILVKPLMDKYSPLVITRWIFTFGMIMIWPFCLTEVSEINFPEFSAMNWLILFIIIVPGTFLAYVFNVYGIKILNASRAGAYIYTQPFLAGIIAVIFLNEEITLYKIFATILIFAGLFLAQKAQQKKLRPKII